MSELNQLNQLEFLNTLSALIAQRAAEPQAGSYTNRLLADPPKAAQKVGEEATEVIIAALVQDDDHLLDEAADLLYHTLVLLQTRQLSLAEVVERLESRHGG